MPVGDLSALNISRHGWFTVYEKVNDIEKIYDTVNNEIADDKLDCVAGGSGADNKYAAVKTGD